MSINLLNTELLKTYSGTYTTNYGEWIEYNGVSAMRLGPAPIYYTNTETHLGLTKGEFKASTSYIFDLWIDADTVYYTSGNKNVPAGFSIEYTDGTKNYATITGNRDNPLGYQHIKLITPSNKTVKGICPYYYISEPAYYRYDSSITEYSTDDIKKSGIFESGMFKENSSYSTLDIVKGGILRTYNIIEL